MSCVNNTPAVCASVRVDECLVALVFFLSYIGQSVHRQLKTELCIRAYYSH